MTYKEKHDREKKKDDQYWDKGKTVNLYSFVLQGFLFYMPIGYLLNIRIMYIQQILSYFNEPYSH